MITYREFIEKMKEKGFVYRNDLPTLVNGHMIKTFPLEKGTIGKIAELSCPEDTILSLCGEDMGCGDYKCSLKCLDNDGNEPFSKEHKAYVLYTDKDNRSKGSVMDIVVTKVVKDEKSIKSSEADRYPMLATVMKMIKSGNNLEYPILMGAYQRISENLIKKSFNLYPNEKMILYSLEPDIDITKTDFKIDLDILVKE
jgi:hypothetical protein